MNIIQYDFRYLDAYGTVCILQEDRHCHEHCGKLGDDRRHRVRDRLRSGQDQDVRSEAQLRHPQT